MNHLHRQIRLNRIIFVTIALLISNVAMLSCAMAMALCTDCPEHAPILCAQPCAEVDATISDHEKSNTPTDRHTSCGSFLTVIVDADTKPGTIHTTHVAPPGSAPPIHVRNCVFLK
jgi:hypothetical protein